MHPVLFELELGRWGSLTIGTYGLFYAVGFLLALRPGIAYARRDGIDTAKIVDLGIVILLAGFVGAKLLLYVIDARYYVEHPIEMVRGLRSAGVFYGGLGLAVAAGWWYVRRHGLPLGKVADLVAPSLALGQGIGRLGCFAAGCCYGKSCSLPWAVTFRDPRAYELTGVPLGLPLHPTQIYHAMADALILVVVVGMMRRRRFEGQVFWLYLLLYALLRLLVEVWRGDSVRGVFLGGALSTSQLISIPLAATSACMLIVLSRRARAGGGGPPGRR